MTPVEETTDPILAVSPWGPHNPPPVDTIDPIVIVGTWNPIILPYRSSALGVFTTLPLLNINPIITGGPWATMIS